MPKKSVATSYPNLSWSAPASDPAGQALAHLAHVKALEALDAKPQDEAPGSKLTEKVLDKVGDTIGELVSSQIRPAPSTTIDDHLKLTKAQREQYDDLIQRQQSIIDELEEKANDLKEQLQSAYERGYKEADEKWQMRVELSERTNARLDEIENKLHEKELEEKNKLIETRDSQISRLLEELSKEREALKQAYAEMNDLKLERIKLGFELEKKDYEHKLKLAESQVPHAKTPQEIYEEAYAKAEASKLQEMAHLDVDKKRKEIEREEEESRARTAVYQTFGDLLGGLAEKAPELLGAFASGNAPSRGYGPPAQAPVTPIRREAREAHA